MPRSPTFFRWGAVVRPHSNFRAHWILLTPHPTINQTRGGRQSRSRLQVIIGRFCCEPGGRSSDDWLIVRAAAGAGLDLYAHPHILRHACGYALANKGHDTRGIEGWLGRRSITSTAVYTASAPNMFKDFWRD
jgi:integrase